MRVPVLSTQTTSVRASSSTAGSSLTRTWRRASASPETANATLLRRTNPSGTIATSAATVSVTAVAVSAPWALRAIVSAPTGTSSAPITCSTTVMPRMISESARVNRRPIRSTRAAQASSPTAVARHRPLPATTKLPERTSSRVILDTGFASPVRADSSSSRPVAESTSPSTTSWSPGPSATTSSSTTSATATSVGVPSRMTVARGAVIRASRSRVRFARSSWAIPIAELATRTSPNSPSRQEPYRRINTSRVPSTRLNHVSRFVRRISATGRLVRERTVFVRPAATRSRTSAAVSPVTRTSSAHATRGVGDVVKPRGRGGGAMQRTSRSSAKPRDMVKPPA